MFPEVEPKRTLAFRHASVARRVNRFPLSHAERVLGRIEPQVRQKFFVQIGYRVAGVESSSPQRAYFWGRPKAADPSPVPFLTT